MEVAPWMVLQAAAAAAAASAAPRGRGSIARIALAPTLARGPTATVFWASASVDQVLLATTAQDVYALTTAPGTVAALKAAAIAAPGGLVRRVPLKRACRTTALAAEPAKRTDLASATRVLMV